MNIRQGIVTGAVALFAAAALGLVVVRAIQRVPVETAVIREGVVDRNVTVNGKLSTLRTAQVISRRSGVIEAVLCHPGDGVGVGETVAVLAAQDLVQPQPIVARTPAERLSQARQDLRDAERELRRRAQDLREAQEGLRGSTAAGQDVDSAQAALRRAELLQEQAERDLQQFESQAFWGQMAQAEAEARRAEAVLGQVTRELQNARRAVGAGIISTEEYRTLEYRCRGVRLAREAAVQRRAALAQAPEALQQRQARQALEQARSQVRLRRGELMRAGARSDDQAAVQSRIQAAQMSLVAAQERVADRRAVVAALERDAKGGKRRDDSGTPSLDTGYMTAPMSGTVLKVHVKPGDGVRSGQAVATMGDLGSLVLAAEVGPSRASHVRVGQTAKVYTKATGNQSCEAVVSRVVPLPQQGKTRIELFVSDDLAMLKPEAEAEAVIAVGTDEPGLLVPPQSVTQLPQGQRGMYVVRGARAVAVVVAVAESSAEVVRVAGDARPGELVVLSPLPDMRDGRAVSVMRVAGQEDSLTAPSEAGGGGGDQAP